MNLKATKQSGFSLIELMVSVTLGLIISLAAVQLHISNQQTFLAVEELTTLQEGARFVVNTMSKDLTMVDYIGCAQKQDDNLFTTVETNNYESSLTGKDGEEKYSSEELALLEDVLTQITVSDSEVIHLKVSQNSDTLTIRYADTNEVLTVTSGAPNYVVPGLSDLLDKGKGLTGQNYADFYISDCSKSSTFRLRTASGIPQASLGSKSYTAGSEVFLARSISYFVATDDDNEPSLYQQIGDAEPSKVVDGIENMQILYGIDTDDDEIPNQYAKGSGIDFNDVVSVRIAFVIRTSKDSKEKAETRTFRIGGTNYVSPNDRRMRQVVQSTVKLRNRL